MLMVLLQNRSFCTAMLCQGWDIGGWLKIQLVSYAALSQHWRQQGVMHHINSQQLILGLWLSASRLS